ncbi:hypothetical protein XJ44_03940 [Thermosipho affectus]|uniref:HTH cro/C1-type domain-containing protein n=1 Tax=Thermosipho affectus TaxID=660294 RepID=A0ABX3IJK3_9BACT|nr:type II toxin-antitoxin system antitoxin SocA domain-containing protein [Thermosipho affectus]ONN27469.1 hypothetical protein XJ44_03940 [Thermosipho affectus]
MKCPKCGAELKKRRGKEKRLFKGKEVEVSYDVFVCPQCKSSFIDFSSIEKAWRDIWNKYEKGNNIPSPDILRRARENLKLTGEELAKIIGRTKSLISKLENGTRRLTEPLLKLYLDYIIPGGENFAQLVNEALIEGRITKEERDEFLKRIALSNNTIDVIFEQEILSEHGNIPSDLNGYTVFDGEKFCSVVSRIMSIKKTLDIMKLFKLIFYIDAVSYTMIDKSITGLRYKSNKYGPTPYNYDLILTYLKKKGVVSEHPDKEYCLNYCENYKSIKNLSKEEDMIIDLVLKEYGNLSSKKLSELTHKEKCWKETERGKIIRFKQDMIHKKISVRY